MTSQPSWASPGSTALPLSDPALAVLVQVADSVRGIDAIERMLVAYALHRDGLDFDRAHLLLYDAGRDELVAWAGAAARPGPASVTEAVLRAGLAPVAAPSAVRAVRWPAGTLEGLAHLAWEGDPVALHAPEHEAFAEGAVLLAGCERRHGLLVGGWSSRGDEDERRARLAAFHAAARHVLTAWDRRREGQRTRGGAEALAEIGRAAVSSHHLAEVLHLAVEHVVRHGDVAGAAVWLAHGPESLRLEARHGEAPGEAGEGALHALARNAWSSARSEWIEDAARTEEPAGWGDVHAAAALPVSAYGHTFGALTLFTRVDGRPGRGFDAIARGFLGAVADQVALAIDQAERFGRLERAAERERELRTRVQTLERAAEHGATAREQMRTLRVPARSIAAFARRAHAGLGEGDALRDVLEALLREAERLESGLADTEVPASTVSEIERIAPNELLQTALQGLGETLVRRRIRLVKKLSADLPRLILDTAQIREALIHLLRHAVDSLAPGGRLRVESRKVPGHVLFEIAHDGAAAPGDGLEQLLAAFATPGTHGVPSLTAAERIVRRHGGEIRTRRQGEWSSVIAFSLPIRGNQDRRRANLDRRGHPDRRARFPEALGG